MIFQNVKRFLLENANRFLGMLLGLLCVLKIYGLWKYRGEVQLAFSENVFYFPSQLIVNNLVHITYLAIASSILLLARKPKRQYSQSTPILISLLGSFLPYLLLIAPVSELPQIPIIVPVLFVFVGGLISLIGLLSLRKSFSITPEVRGFVVSGIYSFIRHPMYLGGFVSVAGILLSSLSIFSLVVYLVWLVIQIWRAGLEEQLLLKEYPEYQKYRQKTAAFVPMI
ncbi:putative protein-S-isoprenylcysteine methyltransferase [Xenococcus sp. PCC 7305]|uniref:methyltransferase family protein n=1 Tax=Xenococcus sp. PCC 7305 TaxID=102125 RepID=UPI0002AD029A|nr:methyltransferase [Xenococcus sp. PCC 7305]ELS02141.1 putative protein-S-isoprenylcysteine methyltransferase [Xenococcus sp. PCC 7305]